MKWFCYISVVLMVVLCGCSVKRNNFFSRNYHQFTTRYNVYFNGNQALKSGEKNMEIRHREDYTNLLPVFVSNDEQTRTSCSSDMDYAAEKAVKAIDKHSITVKPRRRKNKDSKSYQTFRKKKEFNNQLDRCYLLLGKAYFYKKKYAQANNTFRFIQRQYAGEEKIMTETAIWLFRSLTEMKRYDEALQELNHLEGVKLKRRQRELIQAAKTDFYVRQGMYAQAIPEMEKLIDDCKSLKRKPRYNYILSQLYLKEGQNGNAMTALKRALRFNFNYEMAFNAKINMALAYRGGDESIEGKLRRMLRDARNNEFQDRIFYALGNIEEKRGEKEKAVELYWKSVQTSVDNANQQALSFWKLGDYYFEQRHYVQAQNCYDSCLYAMDAKNENYERLQVVLGDLTVLTGYLQTIQWQDSVLKLANLSEEERNRIIDNQIETLKTRERLEREQEQVLKEQEFYGRDNKMGANQSNTNTVGEWYFYNPVTIALGKNEFKRKWGRRKLEDHWRRNNKAMVGTADIGEELVEENSEEKREKNAKSREYYLQDIPLTKEKRQLAEKKLEEAYYGAGETYLYKFDDPERAMVCFNAYIQRFPESHNLPMIYYLASLASDKAGKSAESDRFRTDLIRRFPDSDFALGLQDPNYFKKIEETSKTVEQLYERAFTKYEQVYYQEAEQLCDEILRKYPDNKLKANVLFLKAMCMLNSRSTEEGRVVLEEVMNCKPSQEMQKMVNDILASLSTGNKPVVYTKEDMSHARNLKNSRDWRFDEETLTGRIPKEKTTYQMNEDGEQLLLMILPEDFNLSEEMHFKARMNFINASEASEGKKYELEKKELWFKQEALVVRGFENVNEIREYMERVGTDKYLLKMIGERSYRIFIIDTDNLSVLKRLKHVDDYTDFFEEHYFTDRRQGEIMSGKWGTAAHVFSFEEEETHHFILAVPFREVNTKRIAEALQQVEPGFSMVREEYGSSMEFIVVKNIGDKARALEYRNTVLKDKTVFDRLAGMDYETFVITDRNLKALQENNYLDEYLKFFDDHYLKSVGAMGIEYGDYVYNKGVPHQFVLVYSNRVDSLKLKTVFEEFNFSGLKLSVRRFDDTHDYMVVSGFTDKEEGMRYFNTVLSNRKLFKSLRGVDYTNFMISDVNLQTLLEKKGIELYLEFFKKYYLN